MTSHPTSSTPMPAETAPVSASQRGDADRLIETVIKAIRLRAGGFIVTIYGDVVEPRGGHLWIGNLIETCASVGISESLVRTAVSRLVAADRLKGSREGRRSYYSLSEAAQTEFMLAAGRIFEPKHNQGWCCVWLPERGAEPDVTLLEWAGFRRLAAGWWLGPRATLPTGLNALVLDGTMTGPKAMVQAMAANLWDWSVLDEGYAGFVRVFTPVRQAIEDKQIIAPDQMLQLRLLMVHQFRQVALRDPDLPPDALPDGWIGHLARALFAELYHALSPLADAYVASHFVSAAGPLAAQTVMTERRLALLAGTFIIPSDL